MTEQQNASPQQRPLFPPSDHLAPSTSRDSDRSRDRHPSGSPETGASSRSDSLMTGSWTADATLVHRSHEEDPSTHNDTSDAPHQHAASEPKRSSHTHRSSNKHKSTGAFLLSDPFDEPAVDDLRGRKQRPRRVPDKRKGKGKGTSARPGDEHAQNARQSGIGLGLPLDLKKRNGPAEQPPGTPPRASAGTGAARRHDDFLHPSPGVPSPGSSNASADMDSTQIVSMALNLSESRRLAQRRLVSQTMPPRLASLPSDNTVGGTLKQQLQQQRRVSRTISPRPERDAVPRVASGGKVSGNGTLQPAFEPMGTEGSFRYNFSNSTMARAQKAKDYMELLAQYRRVIELLPPLKPNSLSKVSTSEFSPSMPMSLDTVNATGQIGRPYDPLQYIRNRKVRARERKTIDGEHQGFGDVSRVTDWIDDVAKWVATRQIRTPGSPALPPFCGADLFSMEHSPPTQIPRAASATVKAKRPRNDWVIEPADLLADIYWLEQDDHKRLVENRHWQRVFPQDSGLYRPLSRATDEPESCNTIGVDRVNEKSMTNSKLEGIDPPPSSTRGKAREKLREIRGFHRHSGLSHGDKHNHSRLRVRRDSSSSSSSSDSETRSRRGTSGDTDKDILEKQMMEMMERDAREAKEEDAKRPQEAEVKQLKPRPSQITAARPPMSTNFTTPSRQPSHSEFRIDASEIEDKAIGRSRTGSPQRPSRESLDVPSFRGRRMSIGSESSAPNSPDYRSSRRDNYFIPGIGADLSPASSRAGSPSRNPLSRVKQIFRDRSRDRVAERHHDAVPGEIEGSAEIATKAALRISSTPDMGPDKASSQSRTNSIGPGPKVASRTTGDSHKSHRKSNSLRLVDPGAGLRSLFKGPRIDSVLKSGVSRVSDLFWKKDSEEEEEGSDSTASLSDDSDDEDRGRRKATDSLSPTPSLRNISIHPKQEGHFLDVMPAFIPASEHKGRQSRSGSGSVPVSRTTSRRSTRFELLKPPRIDISAATDPPSEPNKDLMPDASDIATRLGCIAESLSHSDLLQQGPSRRSQISGHGLSAESVRNSGHFSISNQNLSSQSDPISRHEVARLRTLVLSSGIMAMEMARRANEPTTLTAETSCGTNHVLSALGNKVAWPEIAQLVSADQRRELLAQAVSQADLFPLTAHVLGTAIHSSRQRWQSEAESFKHRTRTELINGRIEQLRQRVGLDLTAMTRTAAEEADEVGGDLVDGQRRKVKAVVDVIDKLLRRRRRRFRWVRRAGWLALEWLLVGFMWYVWFVVMIARIFLGVGKGVVRGVRWLLWL